METCLRWEGSYEIFLWDHENRLKYHEITPNVILDVGLDFIGFYGYNPDILTRFAAVGTSSTAAATSQTGLISELTVAQIPRTKDDGGVIETLTYVAGSPPYWSWKRSRQWSPGMATATLNEVGMCMFNRTAFSPSAGSAKDPFWSRQVFGPIVKAAGDTLRIVYELRMYPPTADHTETLTVDGVSTNFLTRSHMIDDASTWGRMTYLFPGDQLGTIPDDILSTDSLPGTQPHAVGDQLVAEDSTLTNTTTQNNTWLTAVLETIHASLAGYSTGAFKSEVRNTWDTVKAVYPTGVGIVFSSLCLSGYGKYGFQTSISPKITKPNTYKLQLDLRVTWGRYP